MQVSTSLTSTVATAPASAGAVPLLLGKEGELAGSSTFAPVDEVSLAERVATEDTYAPLRRRLARKAEDETDTARAVKAKDVAAASEQNLDDDQLSELQALKKRDQEVRSHEQAHTSVGGAHAGAASFSYQTGADGVRYAVAGEVNVDLSAVSGDAEATIVKMEQIQRAALAPAEPSAQDRQVAAQAGQQAASAVADLAAEQSAVQREEIARLEAEKADLKAEMADARKEQKEAEEKEAQEEAVSAAERFAEYNAKLRRLNEVLLRISMPMPVSAGQLLDDMA